MNKVSQHNRSLHSSYFEKSSNMAKLWKKMKKGLVQLALNPFFGRLNPISSTRSVTTLQHTALYIKVLNVNFFKSTYLKIHLIFQIWDITTIKQVSVPFVDNMKYLKAYKYKWPVFWRIYHWRNHLFSVKLWVETLCIYYTQVS